MNFANSRVRIEYVIAGLFSLSLLLYISSLIKEGVEFKEVIPDLTIIIITLVVVALPNRSLPRTVGLFSIVLGLQSLSEAYLLYMNLDGDFTFIIFLMHLGVGIMLIFNAITYLRGMSRNTNIMMYSLLLVVGTELLITVVYIRTMFPVEGWSVFSSLVFNIPYYASIVLFIILAKSDGISQNTTMWKINDSIHKTGVSLFADDSIAMSRDSLKKLQSFFTDGLKGPSASILLKTSKESDLKLMLENIGENIQVTITATNDRAYVNGFIFRYSGMTCIGGNTDDCDCIRIYGEDGIFTQFTVVDVFDSDGTKRLSPIKKVALMRRSDC